MPFLIGVNRLSNFDIYRWRKLTHHKFHILSLLTSQRAPSLVAFSHQVAHLIWLTTIYVLVGAACISKVMPISLSISCIELHTYTEIAPDGYRSRIAHYSWIKQALCYAWFFIEKMDTTAVSKLYDQACCIWMIVDLFILGLGLHYMTRITMIESSGREMY